MLLLKSNNASEQTQAPTPDEQPKKVTLAFDGDLKGFENIETYKIFSYFEYIRKENPEKDLKALLKMLQFIYADQIVDTLNIKADLAKTDFDKSNSADYALYCCRVELIDYLRSGFTTLVAKSLKEIQEHINEQGVLLCTEFVVNAMTQRVNWEQIADYFIREFQNKEA